MGKTTFTLTAILLLPLLACAHHAATPAVESSQRLEGRRDAFLAALSARELEATMAIFSEDAVVHVAGFAPLKGRDAIRPFYANVFRFLSVQRQQQSAGARPIGAENERHAAWPRRQTPSRCRFGACSSVYPPSDGLNHRTHPGRSQ